MLCQIIAKIWVKVVLKVNAALQQTLLLSLNANGENRRFDRCIVDWTNQCKSHLPLVAKSAFLQTATAAHISGPIYEAFFCSGSLKPGSFGYLWQTALALIGPI